MLTAKLIVRNVLVSLIAVFSLTNLSSPAAHAREEILRYESLLEVQRNGDVVVTEKITVRAEGRQIKRGIYRDLPLYYSGKAGDRQPSGVELIDVGSDVTGNAHFTKKQGAYLRVYMGERSRFLQPGVYTYTFRYSMENHVGFFKDYDEIYWNVTGDQWRFPIREVISRIVAPDGSKVLQTAAYTGRRGETGGDYIVHEVADNIVEFQTTRPLQRGEEITVAVGWPKGFVDEPGRISKTISWLFANKGLIAILISAFGVPWFLFSSWLRVGRDPEKGVIIPLFKAPTGLSPAAVSFIHFMKLKSAGRGASRALIAAMISLAVKGRITLSEDDETVTARLNDIKLDDLPSGERVLREKLFAYYDTFEFSERNTTRFVKARAAFRRAIDDEHRGIYFNDNRGPFFAAIAMAVVGIVAYLFFQPPTNEQAGFFVFLGIFFMFGIAIVAVGVDQFRRKSFGRYIIGIIGIAFVSMGGSIFSVGDGMGIDSSILLPALAIGVMLGSIVIFGYLLRAPTPLGRKTMDQIEGLKLYLSVAESERMNMSDRPDMSRSHFEELLPYAIALDVERPWSNAFADHMARLMPTERGDGYQPDWYHGRRWSTRGFSRATEGMVDAMSHSMADATPAPSSSGSGSSGGGSAGGGGGGGGGGGW